MDLQSECWNVYGLILQTGGYTYVTPLQVFPLNTTGNVHNGNLLSQCMQLLMSYCLCQKKLKDASTATSPILNNWKHGHVFSTPCLATWWQRMLQIGPLKIAQPKSRPGMFIVQNSNSIFQITFPRARSQTEDDVTGKLFIGLPRLLVTVLRAGFGSNGDYAID